VLYKLDTVVSYAPPGRALAIRSVYSSTHCITRLHSEVSFGCGL